MKKVRLWVIFSLLLLLTIGNIQAQQKNVGLGIILGEPTGLILKYWSSSTTAFDVAASWNFVNQNSFHLHADYLFHSFNLFKVEKGKLPVYYGVGVRLSLEDRTRFGIRIPLGISYMFDKAPFDIFMEVGPVMDVIPATEFTVLGFIGFRYYF
ncbi:MAG: hypothetical protein ACPLZD_08060 [Candidatus Saccharicenans sp.]|nr:MAG: hypothetical protein C0168_07725 [Candidatus Aminicenantes bacterium]HEK86506.1 hypothetical protein [Candidatus Aminicenantes bacterium]